MRGLPRKFLRHLSGLRDVVEHHHHTDNFSIARTNRRRRIFDGYFTPISCHEQGVIRQADNNAFTQAACHWTFDDFSVDFVANGKNRGKRLLFCFSHRPPG